MRNPDYMMPHATLRQRKVMRCRAELHRAGHTPLAVRTIDISLHGMSLISQHDLAPGTCCDIQFQIAVRGRLHLVRSAATILYNTCQGSEGFRIGLRFADSDPGRSALIETLY